MTKLSVYIATSLDGYIASTDDDLAWLENAVGEGEDYGYDAFMSDIDALAMGRGTYDYIAHIDPLPFGERQLYVFTHRPPEPRDGVTFWAKTPEEALTHWEAEGVQHVYVDGGRLISDFLDVGLIDELTIATAPVLLGAGRPLFHPVSENPTALELVSMDKWPSGFVSRTYRRVR